MLYRQAKLVQSSKMKKILKSIFHLTVKRGVSRLISSKDTSTPITPRISWFYNKREKGTVFYAKNAYSSTQLLYKLIFLLHNSCIPY